MNYDRVILELMDRVSTLEDEVLMMKSKLSNGENVMETKTVIDAFSDSVGRDNTNYILDGRRWNKNRLVLAIVKKYMKEHPNTTAEQLLVVFDKRLQGSLGVVRKSEEVKKSYADYERRFFVSPHEIIKTTTDDCIVCTQWGKFNIDNMVSKAKQLGYEITAVK